MKKSLYTALALLLVSAVFVNCQKDGVFNPKKKINKIYKSHEGGKYLIEEWTWEGNLLGKIAYCNDTNVLRKAYYFYDKKQLVRVENTNDLSYVLISYNKSQYDKMDFYTKYDRKVRSYTFTYDKKKISKIDVTVYKNPAKSAMSIEDDIMSAFIPKIILEETNKLMMGSPLWKSDGDDVFVYTLKYDGDNVVEWKISDANETKLKETVFQYSSYDKNMNPYYMSNPTDGTNPVSFTFCKNNPLQMTRTQYVANEKIASFTFDYIYKYDDKKYPTEVIEKQIGESYTNSDTTYYEYINK